MEWVPTFGTIRSFATVAELVEEALRRNEGVLAENGAFAVLTGERIGLSPDDLRIVEDDLTGPAVDWRNYRPALPGDFDRLEMLVDAWFQARPAFTAEVCIDTDEGEVVPVRVLADKVWYALYASRIFRALPDGEGWTDDMNPWQIAVASEFRFDPTRHGTTTEAAIVLNLTRRRILIAGTGYAGEIESALLCALSITGLHPRLAGTRCRTDFADSPTTSVGFGSILMNVAFRSFTRVPDYSSRAVSDTPEMLVLVRST